MFGFIRIAFINCVILYHACATNEHWYVRLVLITGHCICHLSWLVIMCDIWPVVGVSIMMNATCRTWPYLPSSAFVSNSSFNGVPLAQSLVSNADNFFAICYISLFDLCPSVCWFIQSIRMSTQNWRTLYNINLLLIHKLHCHLSTLINNLDWMCSFNQMSSKVRVIVYEG